MARGNRGWTQPTRPGRRTEPTATEAQRAELLALTRKLEAEHKDWHWTRCNAEAWRMLGLPR